MRKRTSQLDLFATPKPTLDAHYAEMAGIAARLPPGVRFGTSSWAFPGWTGFVWSQTYGVADLSHAGLLEYVQHPLLTTVEIDAAFYTALPDETWLTWAEQLPPRFPACIKAPRVVTEAVDHETQVPNPEFLSVEAFERELGGALAQCFVQHVGCVILEISPVAPQLGPSPEAFVRQLDAFLAEAPRQFRYAIELRNAGYLTTAYRDVLARRGASHVYSYTSRMPWLPQRQATVVPIEQCAHAVFRLLLAPGGNYEKVRDAWRPFDQLRKVDPLMRAQVCALLASATGEGRETFVLVGNKAEGCAPRTIEGIARELAASRIV